MKNGKHVVAPSQVGIDMEFTFDIHIPNNHPEADCFLKISDSQFSISKFGSGVLIVPEMELSESKFDGFVFESISNFEANIMFHYLKNMEKTARIAVYVNFSEIAALCLDLRVDTSRKLADLGLGLEVAIFPTL